MYTHTVSKCYVSGLLVISKKIIVLDISFKICNFLDTLSSARILNLNYIHFQTRFTLQSIFSQWVLQCSIKIKESCYMKVSIKYFRNQVHEFGLLITIYFGFENCKLSPILFVFNFQNIIKYFFILQVKMKLALQTISKNYHIQYHNLAKYRRKINKSL